MFRHHLESLELRTLLAVTLDNGTLRITGTDNAEAILVTENGAGQITVQLTSQLDAEVNAADVTDIDVDALAGDDTITIDVNRPTTIRAGAGNDTITGSDGGADSVIGQQGADVAQLRGGDDVFVWNPGDGSDRVDGQGGTDTLLFNGSGGDELFEVSPLPGNRVLFFRNLGNINMDMGTTERFELNALGGADQISIRDTSGTDLDVVQINLEGTAGSGQADGSLDRVTLFGSSAADQIALTGDAASGIAVTGLSALVNIANPDATDALIVDGRGGSDRIDASALAADAGKLTLRGNTGHDTLLGGAGEDTFIGGDGNDAIDGNRGNDTANMDAGNDTFTWDPGDGSDIVEGGAGFDTMLFNGAIGDEIMEASANGSRLRFTRNLGNIVMDVNDTEKLDVRALGGNDTVTIGDLSATATRQVFADGGEGNDSLVGGPGRDTFVGGLGEDSLAGNGNIDVLNGNTSAGDDNAADRVLGGSHNDFATFGNGDRFDMGAGTDQLIFAGTRQADLITVDFRFANNQPRARLLTNGGDKQAIFANGEIVTVEAGVGNDTVVMSQAAADVWRANFVGGSGHDLLIGGNLDDTLRGESGNDTLLGRGGIDDIDGGSGSDVELQ